MCVWKLYILTQNSIISVGSIPLFLRFLQKIWPKKIVRTFLQHAFHNHDQNSNCDDDEHKYRDYEKKLHPPKFCMFTPIWTCSYYTKLEKKSKKAGELK